MRISALTLLLAFALLIASVVNYSFFVRNSNAQTRTTSNSTNPANTVEREDNGMQSWAWLIPLLGLPILLYPFKGHAKSDEADDADDLSYLPEDAPYFPTYEQAGVGMKGGKSGKQQTDRQETKSEEQ